MFFRSKLFNFLLPLCAYLFFAIIWAYNFKEVWYNNVPEETLYFTKPNMGYYAMIAYTFMATLIIYLVFGLIYLIKKNVGKVIIYLLIFDLILSSYCLWIYAVTFNTWRTNTFLLFLNMAMFVISIFQFVKPAQSSMQVKNNP